MTDPPMGARRVGLLALLAAACVGTNPRWDAPDDDAGDGDSTVGTGDDVADATGDGSTVGDDASSGVTESSQESSQESSWTGSDEASSGSPSAEPCDEGKTSCAGECKDTSKDRRACGPDCVDCTELFDSKDAVCEAGECRDDGGPSDDDDGDD